MPKRKKKQNTKRNNEKLRRIGQHHRQRRIGYRSRRKTRQRTVQRRRTQLVRGKRWKRDRKQLRQLEALLQKQVNRRVMKRKRWLKDRRIPQPPRPNLKRMTINTPTTGESIWRRTPPTLNRRKLCPGPAQRRPSKSERRSDYQIFAKQNGSALFGLLTINYSQFYIYLIQVF